MPPTSSSAAATSASIMCRSRMPTAPPCWTTSTCISDRARPLRSSAGPATASPRSARLLAALLRRHRWRGSRRWHRRSRHHAAEPAAPHRDGARRAVPVLGIDPRQHRLRSTRRVLRRRGCRCTGRRGRRVHSRDVGRLRHRRRRTRLHAIGRAAPTNRDCPRAADQSANPRARRLDVGHRCPGRAADPRRVAAADGRANDADHRPSSVDHQSRGPCRRGGRRTRHRPGNPR